MPFAATPAGEMNCRLKVISNGPGALNELGETQPVETAAVKIWAKVTAIAGTEKYVNAQNIGDVTHEIRCRYVPYIDHTSTLMMGDRRFDVVSVIDADEPRKFELLILAHEVKA